MAWSKRRRADPVRVAEASLLGARRRLVDLGRPGFTQRFTETELARELADARASVDECAVKLRALGGDPDDPRLEPSP